MAHGGYEPIPEWNEDYDIPDDDDDNSDQTGSFVPNGASTPAFGQYQARSQEETEMKTIQEKSGLPETSYAETSFGGTEDLERRLADLRRDSITGLLNTTKIPNVENPLSYEEREKEIQRVRNFIKARYPNTDFSKLVIRFSSEKPMDIVVLGKKGGKTKIIKDNGSDFQKSFLNLTYVKNALGESFEQIQRKTNQEIIGDRKKLADVEKKSPENEGLINALKDKISKKKQKKLQKKRSFTAQKNQKKLKSEKKKLKNKMKKIKKS